jgi:hypothetical protein
VPTSVTRPPAWQWDQAAAVPGRRVRGYDGSILRPRFDAEFRNDATSQQAPATAAEAAVARLE